MKGGTALPVTSLKPLPCAVPAAGIAIASSPSSDKGTWTSAHKAANPGAPIPGAQQGPRPFGAPEETRASLLPLAGLMGRPWLFHNQVPTLCLDFPKTNICLASPVWSRSVLSREGWGRAAAAPGVGGEWDGL